MRRKDKNCDSPQKENYKNRSENFNKAILRILQRLSGTPRFPYQKRFLLSKYKDTSIWYQRNEGFYS